MCATMKKHEVRRWIHDFRGIPLNECEGYLFKEPKCVREWLGRKDLSILVAGRGSGKTLLLQVKHQKLLERHQELHQERNAYLELIGQPVGEARFIPANGVDRLVGFFNHGGPDHWAGDLLEDSVKATQLWIVALGLSIIVQACGGEAVKYLLDTMKRHSDERVYNYFQNYFNAEDITIRMPSAVITHLLTDSASGALAVEICQHSDLFIEQIMNQVSEPVYLFVDATDEIDSAFWDKSIWVNIQTGLIEAAWKISQANSKVQIYTAIRREAWINYSHANKQSIEGVVCQLNYADHTGPMIEHLFQKYENSKLNDLLGFSSLQSPNTHLWETPTEFLLRHTLNKHRDMVKASSLIAGLFGQESLKSLSAEEKIQQFRLAVYEYTGRSMIEELLNDNSLFLLSLAPERDENPLKKLDILLGRLQSNILSRQEISRASEEYDSLTGRNTESLPFCDLYRIGLLGLADVSPSQGKQRFQSIFGQDVTGWMSVNFLPEAEFYILHPCLDYRLRKLYGRNYKPLFGIQTGDGLPIDQLGLNLIRVQKGLRHLYNDDNGPQTAALELISILEELFIGYVNKQVRDKERLYRQCDKIIALWKTLLKNGEAACLKEIYFNVADELMTSGTFSKFENKNQAAFGAGCGQSRNKPEAQFC